MKQNFELFNIVADALPAPLPAGERVIWQGKPSVKGLALRAFHVREVALYFGLVLAWRLWSNASSGTPAAEALIGAAWLIVPAIVSVAVLSALAWTFARAALYTITDRRVVLQFGVALPMTLNIPLDKISGAALKTYRDGSGDIPLTLNENKASYLLLWPHARPWRLRDGEPMLRNVPDAAQVAAKLAEALLGRPAPAAIATNHARPADRTFAVHANAAAA